MASRSGDDRGPGAIKTTGARGMTFRPNGMLNSITDTVLGCAVDGEVTEHMGHQAPKIHGRKRERPQRLPGQDGADRRRRRGDERGAAGQAGACKPVIVEKRQRPLSDVDAAVPPDQTRRIEARPFRTMTTPSVAVAPLGMDAGTCVGLLGGPRMETHGHAADALLTFPLAHLWRRISVTISR